MTNERASTLHLFQTVISFLKKEKHLPSLIVLVSSYHVTSHTYKRMLYIKGARHDTKSIPIYLQTFDVSNGTNLENLAPLFPG